MENENVVEVVLWGSPSYTLRNSIFKDNEIIDFRVSLSIGDLSNIDNFIVSLPDNIYHEKIIYNLNRKILKLNAFIDSGYKVRVWSSHCDVDCYLLLLFICNCLVDKVDDMIVLYSDEYNERCFCPGAMTSKELEELSLLENILSKKDICELSNKWNIIKEKNSNVRIIQDNNIKSVNYEYFDDVIIDIIDKFKSIKIIDLTFELSKKYGINDSLFIFLISRLINLGKIKIIESDEIFIKSVIKTA